MTTSLNEITQAEDFLQGNLKPEDSLVFRARLLVSPLFRKNFLAQQKTYSLIRLYGRRKLKSEIESIQEKFFNDPDNTFYRQKIEQLFTNLK